MHKLPAKIVDWIVIQLASSAVVLRPDVPTQANEARTLLNHPDFFSVGRTAPRDFQLRAGGEFSFTSPVATPFEENNQVHGRLFQCQRDWSSRPSLILLHGWNAEWGYSRVFPRIARKLVESGVNAATIELPYHAQRRPRRPAAVRDFISEDLLRVVEATQQAIADTRVLVHWLKDRGSRATVVWGFSLGAWLSGLVANVEPLIDGVVLVTPLVRLEQAVSSLPFCAPLRHSLTRHPVALDRLNLLSRRPCSGAEKTLLIESIHDLFVPPESIEELWRNWGGSEIWRVPHGHISVWASRPLLDQISDWVISRLG